MRAPVLADLLPEATLRNPKAAWYGVFIPAARSVGFQVSEKEAEGLYADGYRAWQAVDVIADRRDGVA